jgi:transposase
VWIHLAVRRFFCGTAGCPRVTFAEQVEGVALRYARRTPPLVRVLAAVALALAGRAGARLAAVLGVTASRSSLLRLIAGLPDPPAGPVRLLGVDDFAFRRGQRYGTLLVNVATGRPVDLLPGREAGTLAAWLRAHPGTTVICRDRAGAYAEGARAGAPGAVQVADRWHLWHNLAEHAEKAAARHRGCLAAPAGPPPAADPPAADPPSADPPAWEPPLAARTRQRHEQVQTLLAQGKTISAIARQLHLTRGTVYRYARTRDVTTLLATALDRPSPLNPFKPYLLQQWDAGQRTMTVLHAQITAMGYHGSYASVHKYLAPRRALPPSPAAAPRLPPPAPPALPSTRQITSWIMRHPAHLTGDEQRQLTTARARCPHLDALATHITQFARILTTRHGDRLDDWITTVRASDLPDLHSFARGLQRDYTAVRNGLTLPWNSGTVEGNVNRIKMLKRQMYGRASLPLLRKRVLLA